MERRYGDEVRVDYHNVESPGVREEYADVLSQIETRGLLYPVTVMDGTAVYDGAVSYPAIMRAVHNKLVEREGANAT